jgi:hypothetical protein
MNAWAFRPCIPPIRDATARFYGVYSVRLGPDRDSVGGMECRKMRVNLDFLIALLVCIIAWLLFIRVLEYIR